jgi:hypothetical protein
MTGRELFGALTRLLGLLLATYGIYYLAYEAIALLGMRNLPQRVSLTAGLIFGAVYVVLGLVLLLGGGLIVRLAYRQENSN